MAFKSAGWVVLSHKEFSIKEKIESLGTPLQNWDIQINYGIKTGYNEAFIIDTDKRNELIEKSPINAEIIRPILRGRDIKKYNLKHDNKWIIFTQRGINIENYPAVRDYLKGFYAQIKPREGSDKVGRKPGPYKWYEIQDNIAYYKDFDKEKIIWIELTDKPNFALDTKGYYINNTIFFITGEHLKYLLAFLNSRLCEWYFDKIAATSGAGTRRWIKIYIEQICVPKPTELVESKISSMVDSLMRSTIIENVQLKKIDDEIYKLFSLTKDEIALIESAVL